MCYSSQSKWSTCGLCRGHVLLSPRIYCIYVLLTLAECCSPFATIQSQGNVQEGVRGVHPSKATDDPEAGGKKMSVQKQLHASSFPYGTLSFSAAAYLSSRVGLGEAIEGTRRTRNGMMTTTEQ